MQNPLKIAIFNHIPPFLLTVGYPRKLSHRSRRQLLIRSLGCRFVLFMTHLFYVL